MESFKNLISYLKYYKPKVLSVNTIDTNLKKIKYINTANQVFEKNTIYLGRSSEIRFLLRFASHCVFFIVDDGSTDKPANLFQDNCVVLFPEDTDMESLFDECRKYFSIQQELYEYSYNLMQTYLTRGTLQSIIDETACMLDNPVMVIDKNYRVLCEYGSDNCGDVTWLENIKKGYCSYEFVTQFNKINEVRNIQINDRAFMSGCLNSPLRRCICKLHTAGNVKGYLLAIELNSPFTELKMQFLNIASKLISRMVFSSESIKEENHAIAISDVFTDLLSGNLKSKEVIANCLRYSNIALESEYYLVSVNIQNYSMHSDETDHSLELLLQSKIDYVLTTCFDTNVILLIESQNSVSEVFQSLSVHQEFFEENGLTVAISDKFYSLENLFEYYTQTNFVHSIVAQLHLQKTICTYNNLRILDVITKNPTLENYTTLIGNEANSIYSYDEKNNTEYLKTLYTYIRWNRSIKKTSEVLFLHKNTVNYRIQRAKELFHLDLDDYHLQVHLYIGYLIYLLKDNHLLKHEGED